MNAIPSQASTARDLRGYWALAKPYRDFVAGVERNRGLWEGIYRTARIPDWAVDLACAHAQRVRLLVIAEDWCGDASNTVPVLAKLGDVAGCLEMRVIRRDEYPELMDRYLTEGTRSIPVVIALDHAFHEVGHWGPRPSELQAWVRACKDTTPKDERYRHTRRWYARDRGVTTLEEVLRLFQPEAQ